MTLRFPSPPRGGASGEAALRTAALLLVYVIAAGAPAAAHLQVLRGKLVDLVQRSDLIVIGTAGTVVPIGTSLVDTTVTVGHVLAGTTTEQRLTFRGPTRFAPGERYVFFLHHTPTGFAAEQDAGTVFPCATTDDGTYRRTIEALAHALRTEVTARPDAVRAALLPALTANPAPLRYHAALELRALAQAGHPPNATERLRIEQLLHDPAADPALSPLLNELLRGDVTPTAHVSPER